MNEMLCICNGTIRRHTADKIIGIWFSFSHAVAKWIPIGKGENGDIHWLANISILGSITFVFIIIPLTHFSLCDFVSETEKKTATKRKPF